MVKSTSAKYVKSTLSRNSKEFKAYVAAAKKIKEMYQPYDSDPKHKGINQS